MPPAPARGAPGPAAAPRCSRRDATLLVLALVLVAAALAAAVLLPHLRQSLALVSAGLALGGVRWKLFGGTALPFSRVGRLLQGRRARLKAH